MAYIYLEKGSKCFLAADKVAIWEKPPTGDKFGPYKQPLEHVDRLYFHSDFFYYGLVDQVASVSVSHPQVNGLTSSLSAAGGNVANNVGQVATNDRLLHTHGLGYIPKFFAAYDGEIIPHGAPLQTQTAGGVVDRARFVSAYATSTEIRLHEIGVSSGSDLAATSITYDLVVFRTPEADPALPALRIDANNDDIVFGKGKFRIEEAHLRLVGAGDSPFGIALEQQSFIGNGAIRTYRLDGSFIDLGLFGIASASAPASVQVGV